MDKYINHHYKYDNSGRFDENYVDEVLNTCLIQWVEILDTKEIDDRERKEINSYLRLLNLDDLEDNNQLFIKLRNEITANLKIKRKVKQPLTSQN